MYDELVCQLRKWTENYARMCGAGATTQLVNQAADAIEELSKQRDRAYDRLCEWCNVCPEGKRNVEDCEIAALNPEPPKEEV